MAATEERFRLAREQYAEAGVDVDRALGRLASIPISLHCWQGDDVGGFENNGVALGGGLDREAVITMGEQEPSDGEFERQPVPERALFGDTQQKGDRHPPQRMPDPGSFETGSSHLGASTSMLLIKRSYSRTPIAVC